MKAVKWFLLISVLLMSCGTKSPTFPPGTELTISGKLIDDDNKPVPNALIAFQNIREFGYRKQGLIEQLAMIIFFPFIFIDPGYVTPEFFLSDITTDADGTFIIKLLEDKLLRDKDGGINILLTAKSQEQEGSANHSFVVKEKDTDVGVMHLCQLGGIQVSQPPLGENLTISWAPPQETVENYLIRFGRPEANDLVWASLVAGDKTSLEIRSQIFQDLPSSLMIESIFTNGEDQKKSCLTPMVSLPQEITSASAGALSDGRSFTSPDVPFLISSLSDRNFRNAPYLEAFQTSLLNIDFEQPHALQTIVLHQLSLAGDGNIIIEASEDEKTWTQILEIQAETYLHHKFETPITARFLRFNFPANLIDLQELRIF